LGNITLANNNAINTTNGSTAANRSGGGKIVLAGGADDGSNGGSSADGIPDAYAFSTTEAGIWLGTSSGNSTQFYSGGGDVIVRGKSTMSGAPNLRFMTGLYSFGILVINSGTGTIRLEGQSNNYFGINFVDPVSNLPTGTKHLELISAATTGNAIYVSGESNTASGLVFNFNNPKEVLATAGGNIFIKGVGGGFFDGIFMQNLDVLANSGNITLEGGTKGILIRDWNNNFGFRTGSSITASSSNIKFTTDQLNVTALTAGFSTNFNTTGAVTIEPFSNSFNSAVTFPIANLTMGSGVSGLTIGKPTNTSNVTISSATTIAGPITAYGGNININENLNTTAGNAGGDILLKASADITLAANKSITTSGGDVILWANSDAGLLNGSISLRNTSSITTGSNTVAGGNVWIGGGADGATWNGISVGNGYAVPGTSFAPSNGGTPISGGIYLEKTAISTFGGHIKLAADASTSVFGIVTYGANTFDALTGSIDFEGIASSSSSTNSAGILFGLHDISIAANNTLRTSGAGTAIKLTGFGRGSGDAIAVSGLLQLNSSGTGAIELYGTAHGTGRSIVAGNYYHGIINAYSASGIISLNGGSRGIFVALRVIPGATSGPSRINLGEGGTITSSTSNVVLTGDRLTLVESGIGVQTTGTVTVEPFSNSFTSAVTFPIANLTMGSGVSGLTIGKTTNTANITVAAATTIAGPISVYGGTLAINGALTATNSNITLAATTAVTQTAALTANNLELSRAGTFTLTNVSNNVATIAGGTTLAKLGSLNYVDSNALTIGEITNAGIIASGKIRVETLVNNLTLSRNVATDNTATDAIILNAGKSTAIGNATGGDIIVSGTPTITKGTNGIVRLFSGSNANSTGLTSLVGGSANTRSGFDETSASFTPALVAGSNYALFRAAATAPVVLTASSTSASSVVTVNGNITADNGSAVTERGFVYSTTTAPTISDTKIVAGSGTGAFSGVTPTLVTGTYYFRAFATNSIGTSYGAEVTQTILSAPTAAAQSFCAGATVNDLVATGTDLKWYSASTGGSALVSTTVLTAATYYVSQTVSGVESVRTEVVVTFAPLLSNISSISGPTNLASAVTTATYSVTAVSGASSYVWNLPSGLTLTSQTGRSVTVAVSSSFVSGLLTVKAVNDCGETLVRSTTVRKAAVLVGGVAFNVTGNSIICTNATQTYTATTVAGGVYSWTVPTGVTILSGQGTNAITVSTDVDFTSGRINTICNTSGLTLKATIFVAGIAKPSSITGITNLCGITSATYSVVDGAGFTYTWSVPSGMVITSGEGSSSIIVSVAEGTSGIIRVRAQSVCGFSSARMLTVSAFPILGRISGITRVCGAVEATFDTSGNPISNNPLSTYTYSVAAVSGVTSYNWTVPSGATILTGQGANSITVSYNLTTFESGLISVEGVNSCGIAGLQNINVSTATGTITGPTSLCPLTSATYNVPLDLGTDFVWTLPQGMTVTGGAGTANITVSITHPINFDHSNQVSVSFTTGCGGTRTLGLSVNCSDYTNLASAFCGATIDHGDRVSPIGVTGATGYKFNIYNADGTTMLASIENFHHGFSFTQMNFTFGATYQVRVQVKRGSVYGAEGAACAVTLREVPTTTLASYQCGETINYNDRVYPIGVSGATGYKFNIYNADGTTILGTVENPYHGFSFTQMNFTFGAAYQVRVQVKRGSVYGAEGAACAVTLSVFPITTLASYQCGEIVNHNDRVYPIGVSGATRYKFNIYNADGTTMLATIENPYHSFSFAQMDFTPGTTYQVRIQVKQGSAYGAEGAACSITIFGGTYERQQVQENNNKEGIVSLVPSVLTAYPNPFTTSFVILPIAGESAAVSYQIYDVTGKLLENREINASDIKTHAIAENYAIGVYIVIIRQGTTNQTFKMIKQ